MDDLPLPDLINKYRRSVENFEIGVVSGSRWMHTECPNLFACERVAPQPRNRRGLNLILIAAKLDSRDTFCYRTRYGGSKSIE